MMAVITAVRRSKGVNDLRRAIGRVFCLVMRIHGSLRRNPAEPVVDVPN
jgi:hypothetical protein